MIFSALGALALFFIVAIAADFRVINALICMGKNILGAFRS